MSNNKLLYDVNDRPPILSLIVLALQHLFAMFSATILVAININKACNTEIISPGVAFIASGVGTLIYLLCTKRKSPLYLGSSFSFVPPVIAAYIIGGKDAAFTGLMAVGLVYLFVALIVKLIGNKWIKKILPNEVVGPMIMVIGFALAPNAVEQIGIAGNNFAWQNIVIALTSFFVTAIVALKGKKFLRIIPFLIGIIAGYIMAIILGQVDFSSLESASFLSLPTFYIPFKDYSLDFSAIWTIIPISLVSIAEHLGDHEVLGKIVNRNLIEDPGLEHTLMGDGLATLSAAFMGGPANTSYGENISVVGMSKVASIWVIALAAILAIFMGFSGWIIALITTIPNAVLGGVSVLLYGFISVNGLKVLIDNHVDYSNTRNVIIASTMLILGLGGATITIVTGVFTATFSGMALSALIGILLNLILPKEK